MISRQGNSWIVVLRKTPYCDAVVLTFDTRKSAIMFIGNSDLAESAKRTKRKQKEWRGNHPDLVKQYAKTSRQNLKRKLEKGYDND